MLLSKMAVSSDYVDGEFNLVLDEITGEFHSVDVQDTSLPGPKKKRPNTRKRKRNPEQWLRNVSQKSHQAGKNYISSRGKTVRAREIKTKKDCFRLCKFNCARTVSSDDRKSIFTKYYSMTQNEKYHFILQTTECEKKKRKTGTTNVRQYSFYFYIPVNGIMIKVCKQFYLGSLDISQKVIYGVHKRKDLSTCAPAQDGRGKHGNQKSLPQEKLDFIRKHIMSFPKIDSHYCRSTTKRNYLEPQLSIRKMYELYEETCEKESQVPLKFHKYSKIFNEEFNLSFHVPKKDRCDTCCEWEMAKQEANLTSELNDKYEIHINEKNAMRSERKQDRDSGQNVLCFDLQNVITCPKADVSCFFYKSKLNVYNLTGHFSRTDKVYCMIWTELMSGRSGNDLASAVYRLLETIYNDNPDIKELVMWCDSCVPQNRNSVISFAILNFLKENESFEKITIKYSTPGHSGIQEVDSAHSKLDRILSVAEFYSPLSLIRLLVKANKKNPFRVIQLQKEDMKNYQICAKNLQYDSIPFTKVCVLKFTQHYFIVGYKTSHLQDDWSEANIFPCASRSRRTLSGGRINSIQFPRDIPTPKPMIEKKNFPDNKRDALKSMLKFMPLLDRDYYKTILKI